jgi:trimeric autotransporter adhesin
MKLRSIAILILCASLAVTVLAQTGDEEIGGAGTAGFLARFTGSHQIGNSSIFQSPNGNVGIGTTTPESTFRVDNHDNSINSFGLEPYAIYGRITNSTINFSSAIRGDSLVTDGNGSGVIGLTASTGGGGVIGVSTTISGFASGVAGFSDSSEGRGVFGVNTATTGSGGAGVNGSASATTGTVFGVIGGVDSTPVNTDAVGIQASGFNAFRAFSQTCQNFPPCTPLAGTAGLFSVGTGGNILVGVGGNPGSSVFRVDSTGKGFFNGGAQTGGADFAESVAVSRGLNHYGPGDLLALDVTADRQVTLAKEPYSTLVAGIYSTKPGVLATTRKMDDANFANEVPLAIVGIVPCKVSAENGPIRVGDLLVASSTAGHAMKGTDRSRMLGAVVGKALEPLRQGLGIIQVLVTLQ